MTNICMYESTYLYEGIEQLMYKQLLTTPLYAQLVP